MDKKELSEKLNKFFGEENIRIITPKKFLSFVENVLIEQYEKLAEAIMSREPTNLEPLVNEFKENQKLLEKLEGIIKGIKFPEPKEIKIPEYPKEILLKKPDWYEKFIPDEIIKRLEKIEKSISDSNFDKELKSAPFYVNSDRVIIPGIINKVIRVYAIKLITSEDMSVNWRDGVNNIEGSQSFIANGGYTESILPPAFLFAISPGNNLELFVDAKKNGVAAGRVSYWIE